MKKSLLLIFSLIAMNSQGQDFWTSEATTFTQVSRGLDDISIVDANIIWAKAYDGASNTPANVRQYTRSIDGGDTWTSGNINLGTGQTSLNISSITAVSASTAWVSAHPSPSGLGGVWKTIDSGTTWTKQATALFNTSDSFTNFVYFWDATTGITQGDPSDGYFEIYTTVNGGINWTRVPSANIPAPLTGEYGYVHNYDVVGNTIWFGTNKGRFFKSTDQGLNWTVSQSPITDLGGETVSGSYSFTSTTNGLLYTSAGNLYTTIDGGAVWTQTAFAGVIGNRNIEYVPGTNVVVSVGTDTSNPADPVSYTAYSTNNGLNWTSVMPDLQVTTLKFKDNETGFGGGFTISSTEGGVFKYTGNVLGIDSFSKNQKPIAYPNPTQDLLQVSGEDIKEIIIFDMLGKEIIHKKMNPVNRLDLDVSALTKGIYLLSITDDSGTTQTLKFSKE